MIIENDFDCTTCGGMFVLQYDRDNTPTTCEHCGEDTLQIAWVQCGMYLNRYSMMHPQRSRGMGGVRDYKSLTWAQQKRIEKQEALRRAYESRPHCDACDVWGDGACDNDFDPEEI